MTVPYGAVSGALATASITDPHKEEHNIVTSETVQGFIAISKDLMTADNEDDRLIHHGGTEAPIHLKTGATSDIFDINKEEFATTSTTESSKGRNGSLRGRNDPTIDDRSPEAISRPLRLQEEPCVLFLKNTLMEDQSNIEEVECHELSTNHVFHICGIDQSVLLAELHSGNITSGQTTLMQEGAHFNDQNATLEIIPHLVDRIEYEDYKAPLESQRPLSTTGFKKLVVVRVNAPDGYFRFDERQVSAAWFGGDGDKVNLKSQMQACSFDKIIFNPVTSYPWWDGVGTVNININVKNTDSNVVLNAAISSLTNSIGDLPSQFDHVAFCLPRGSTTTRDGQNWAAFAQHNNWVSVFNDEWCNSPTIQMHEIGHNLNLGHSNEANEEYGDRSGIMGASFTGSETPRMCFNGPKSWQLGWYDDRTKTVPVGSYGWAGNLYGVADYRKTSYTAWGGSDIILVKIQGINEDLYVSFNRKSGINSETQEGGDQVLVHKVRSYIGAKPISTLVAKMNEGDSYTSDVSPLNIKVVKIKTDLDRAFATVVIGQEQFKKIKNDLKGFMKTNEFIRSPNNMYSLIYNIDGNLRLYIWSTNKWVAIWSTNTDIPFGIVSMEYEGNLLVWGDRKALWYTNTRIPANRGSFLRVQDDGNLVIYRPDMVRIWSRLNGWVD